MDISTKHAIDDCLRTTRQCGVVFVPQLFQGGHPDYLTASALRLIADEIDSFNSRPVEVVKVNSLQELSKFEREWEPPANWPKALD